MDGPRDSQLELAQSKNTHETFSEVGESCSSFPHTLRSARNRRRADSFRMKNGTLLSQRSYSSPVLGQIIIDHMSGVGSLISLLVPGETTLTLGSVDSTCTRCLVTCIGILRPAFNISSAVPKFMRSLYHVASRQAVIGISGFEGHS